MRHDNGRSDTINVTRTDITNNTDPTDTNTETNISEKLFSLDYEYDGVGNIVSRFESSENNGEIFENTYQYDELNRLKRADLHGSFSFYT